MEGGMPKINFWSQNVPRVEIDQRSREARLGLSGSNGCSYRALP
jgi:hypothetical protein